MIVQRPFAFGVMGGIVTFALIHLGVCIGIIGSYRKYGDVFSPQVGLSSFNLVIALLGLIVGLLGIAAIIVDSNGLARAVCIVSVVLAIFTLASLITALIINSKSLNYLSNTFTSHMMEYTRNPSAKTKVDLLQYKYQCCGTDLWTDWSTVKLNGTSQTTTMPGTNMTTTVSSMNATSVTGTSTSTTGIITTTTSTGNSAAVTTTTTTATSTGNLAAVTTTTTTAPPARENVKRDINHISNDLRHRQLSQSDDYSRKKRQAPAVYGGIVGLPITFGVTLPKSCCLPPAILTSNSSSAYCVSNANLAVNYFYTVGCAKPMDVTAGNQAMGLGVINCFMIVLAIVAIPIMLGESSVPI